MKFKPGRPPVPIEEVEPAAEIVKRFKTGAMSFGSISKEAHETLAIAMNRIGGKSNTGEGGEDPARFVRDPNGDWRRSAIKQVASARFGVTSHYLVNADELQIKMAQGAKPGEGGQLPGHKVDDFIAKIRYAAPGVGLISPPPHHDIYSIEDLAQLIHRSQERQRPRADQRQAGRRGRRRHDRGGVSKAKADVVLISGHDGGTGASPLTSIKHAGAPWELGLAETQQILVMNDLRGRIRVETDGQLKTGRDVTIAALLGAEEFGFASAALVACGLHHDARVPSQHLPGRYRDPGSRAAQEVRGQARTRGQPDDVHRRGGARIHGATRLPHDGRDGRPRRVPRNQRGDHPLEGTEYRSESDSLSAPTSPPEVAIHNAETQDHGLGQALDRQLIELCKEALEHKQAGQAGGRRSATESHGRHDAVGGSLAPRWEATRCRPTRSRFIFKGSAGQSFGAWLAHGVAFYLEGDANDYIGKGLSGGLITVRPPREATFKAEDNIIIGNVALYGATGGEAFFRGIAGERFAVRNSGAVAVVEGVGDHGCEYMTRGKVVVLGRTGRNFAAGMSGGVAYVLDEQGAFASRCNPSMVELLALKDADEINQLRALITRHHQYTESEVARRMLDRWDDYVVKFVKVMPTEYRKVLERQHLNTGSDMARLAAV